MKEATAALRNKFPMIANQLANLRNLSDFNLRKYFHNEGINLRYISAVRILIPYDTRSTECMSGVLLREMIARAIKDWVTMTLRSLMQQIQLSSQAPYDAAIIEIMNTVLSSAHFWTNTIKEMLTKKYGMNRGIRYLQIRGKSFRQGKRGIFQYVH